MEVMHKSYEAVSSDIHRCLMNVGYTGIIEVDVFEHSEGESLELHLDSYSNEDPMNIITGTTDNGTDCEHSLDDEKTLRVVYGPKYVGYECQDDYLIIEMEALNEKN